MEESAVDGSGGAGPRVPDEELDFDEDLILRHRGRLFTGIAYEDRPDLGLSEIHYRNGRQDGPARDWYTSGGLRAESSYRDNALHGTCREFREDGSLAVEVHYEYGIRVRESAFDQDGDESVIFVLSESSPTYTLLQKLRSEHHQS